MSIAIWTETAVSADNAEVTASHAADSNTAHFITHLSASCNVTAVNVPVELRQGSTVLLRFRLMGAPLSRDFAHPIAIERGTAVSVVLAAPGVGVIGQVNIAGYSR